ncbi:hypothetical protein [Pseudomonas sp. BF-R-12]|uniref:hypothetical protein n=1 Tax=Pseudomonas sp. BF-R-12 TaxID=2832363 RepID=UPI001CC11BC1|nr:hypothetical protein [Pseudomonas sp. BF-R-12]
MLEETVLIGRGILVLKENVYDEQISPLAHQIINICKEHNIVLLLSAGRRNALLHNHSSRCRHCF